MNMFIEELTRDRVRQIRREADAARTVRRARRLRRPDPRD